MNNNLRTYLHNTILPQYDTYDKGHNREHILDVVQGVEELSIGRNLNEDMLHTAAVFHDLGLIEGRDTHHLSSARMLREDTVIAQHFTPEQTEIIAQAIEDHRASAKTPPRTIYGEILSSADRIIDPETIIRRSFYHNEKHHPNCTIEENIDLIYKHIVNKYGHGGYLKIPILTEKNRTGLQRLRNMLQSEQDFKTKVRLLIK